MKWTSLLCAVMLFSACLSSKVITEVPMSKNRYDRLCYINTYIGKVHQPTFPLIDAGIFNKKTNGIAVSIMEYQESISGSLEENVLDALKNKLDSDIVFIDDYSKELFESSDLLIGNKGLLLEEDHFSKIISTYPDYNMFDLRDGKFNKYFDDPINYQKDVIDLCDLLDVDGLIFSRANLAVIGIGAFGTSATLRLQMELMVFDDQGRIAASSKGFTKATSIKGKDITQYMEQWQQKIDLANMIIDDVIR